MVIKNINFFVLLILLSFSKISFSQWVFYPKFGGTKNYYAKEEGSPYMYAYKRSVRGRGEFTGDLGNFIGFDLSRKKDNHNFIFTYSIRSIVLWNQIYSTPYRDVLKEVGGHSTGSDLKLFGLSYGYNFDFHWINKSLRNKSGATPNLDAIDVQKHWINFSVTPIVGAGINYVRGTNWTRYSVSEDGSCSESSPDTVGNGLSIGSASGWDKYDCDNLDKIVKNRTGLVLYGGVKLAFLKQEKERLSINFVYHQTFKTYLEAAYYAKIEGVSEVQSAVFSATGNSWSIYFTYPITLINKKGQRRSDKIKMWYGE